MPGDASGRIKLEIVLKCDSFASAEAVTSVLSKMKTAEVEIVVIHSGVGAVSQSDLLMALTGSRFVVGFNVGVASRLDQWVNDHGAEIRLYNVIYKLAEDLKRIALSLTHPETEEKITGRGKVIALFKSSHKAIIIGCEVLEGAIASGKSFRLITAMGPIYTGKIESLQIERKSIKEAKTGQQVGIKLSDFNQARLGDLVECFEVVPAKKEPPWKPSGSILHFES